MGGLRDHLTERLVAVEARLAWQPERALADDVALDLVGAAGDRHDPAVQVVERRGHPRDVAGNPDLLNLTRPEVILDIHRSYFAAGADIATTNTFTATSIGQGDYDLGHLAAEMSREGARLARAASSIPA